MKCKANLTLLLCGCFALPAGAQDDAPGSPAPLKARIEAGYTITADGRPAGSVKARLDPLDERGIVFRNTLTFDSAGARLERAVDARLNPKSFRLEGFELRVLFLGRHHLARLDPITRRLQIQVDGREVDSIQAADAHLDLEIALLALTQTRRLDAAREVHILAHDGERLALEKVTLKPAGGESRRVAGRLLEVARIDVADAPRGYNVERLWIDRAGRVVETALAGGRRIALAHESALVPIDARVTTHYAVVRGDESVGEASASIEPADPGYRYRWESEERVRVLDSSVMRRRQVEAALSRSFRVERATIRIEYAGRASEASYDLRAGVIRFEDRAIPVREPGRFFVTTDLAALCLAQSGALLEPGTHPADVFDSETGELQSVAMAARGFETRAYGGVELETRHVQSALDGRVAADLHLDKFGRALEVSAAAGERLIAVARRGDSGQPLPPRRIQDPLTARTTPRVGERENPYAAARGEVEAAYAEAQRMHVQILELHEAQVLRAASLVPLFRSRVDAFRRRAESLSQFRDELALDLQAPYWASRVDAMERDILSKFSAREVLAAEIAQLRERAWDAARADDAAAAAALRPALADLRRRAAELQDAGLRSDLDRISETLSNVEARRRLEVARFRLEAVALQFKFVSHPVPIRFDVGGAGMDASGRVKVRVPRAYAVIDGTPRGVGESFEKEGLVLTVVAIARDQVTLAHGSLTRTILMEP